MSSIVPLTAAQPPQRGLKYLLALLVVLVLPPAAFYGWFEVESRTTVERNALDAGHANALKHAGAAATLYSMLRFVCIKDAIAESIVVKLGIANEYIEMHIKRGRKDTTLEMMRDLHSNMVGISVARWRQSGPISDGRGRSEQLVVLARAGILASSAENIGLSTDDAQQARQIVDLNRAILWFEQNKPVIELQVNNALRSGLH